MKIFAIFNDQKNSRKTISALMIAKIFSRTEKTIIINLDPFGIYDSTFEGKTKLNSLTTLNLKRKINNLYSNVDLLSCELFIEFNETEINNFINELNQELIKQGYTRIIYDCSASFGLLSKAAIINADFVLIPFVLNQSNIEDLLNKILSLKPNLNFYFIAFAYSDDQNENMVSFLKVQKYLNQFLSNHIVNYYPFKNYKDLLKKDFLSHEFKEILKSLKKRMDKNN